MQHYSDAYAVKKEGFETKEERKQYKAICTKKKKIVDINAFIWGTQQDIKKDSESKQDSQKKQEDV